MGVASKGGKVRQLHLTCVHAVCRVHGVTCLSLEDRLHDLQQGHEGVHGGDVHACTH